MHVPLLARCFLPALTISYLLPTSSSHAQAVQLVSPDSNNASLNLSAPGLVTSRFSALSLTYGDLSSDHFPPTAIALAFIAALAQQALERFDAPLPFFTYTDPDTSVRIALRAAPAADPGATVRRNVCWALKQLPVELFLRGPSVRGVEFKVLLAGRDLYVGRLSDKNDNDDGAGGGGGGGGGGVALKEGGRGMRNGSSEEDGFGLTEEKKKKRNEKPKRALPISRPATNATLSSSPTTTTTLTLAPGADAEYDVRFHFAGVALPNTDVFASILDFLLGLAAHDRDQVLGSAETADRALFVWVFVLKNTHAGVAWNLQVYQVVAMLLAVARYYVGQGDYREMIFNLLFGDALIGGGCVVLGLMQREWCKGLEGWGGEGGLRLGVGGLDESTYRQYV